MKAVFSKIIISASLLFTFPLVAEPWIDTSDIYLKANIRLLADSGHFTTPVTTYPLMWTDISRDLKNIDVRSLSSIEQNAFAYVKHQLKLAKQDKIVLRAGASSEGSKFTSFGDKNRYQHSVQIHSSYMNDRFAVNVSPGYAWTADGEHDYITDGSYVAAYLGNWIVSFGRQDRWFGPMWDSSLSLTNNARPMQALALTRKSAEPVTIPWTEWSIPWTVTTFMGQMDDERVVENTLLWGFRFNFKPFNNLEVGVTRLAQWGGKGHSKSLSTFWDVLIGRTNCGINGVVCDDENANPANQQAGFDMRYSLNLFDTPLGVYGNYFAEDGDASSGGLVTKAQIQVGFDAQLSFFDTPTTAFFEYSDSMADCGARDGIGDCFYEHAEYETGMRYKGRTISHLYDNDADTFVFGTISQLSNYFKVTNKLRYLDLNYDKSDKAPDNPIIGNPLTSVHQKVWMISSNVEHSYQNWRYSIGGDLSQTKTVDDNTKENEINIYFNVEYIL